MARIMLSFKKSFLEKEGLTKEGMERCLSILSKEFKKAQDQHDFEYFKKRALACLRKQYKELEEKEKEEKKVSKAFILAEAEIEKAFPVGTIRTWKGKKFIKSPDKKWRPYYENHKMRGEKLALAALAKKINALQDGDYEGLYKLLTLYKSRFTSDGSLIKDLYNAMKVRGALGNGRFSKKDVKPKEEVKIEPKEEPKKEEEKPKESEEEKKDEPKTEEKTSLTDKDLETIEEMKKAFSGDLNIKIDDVYVGWGRTSMESQRPYGLDHVLEQAIDRCGNSERAAAFVKIVYEAIKDGKVLKSNKNGKTVEKNGVIVFLENGHGHWTLKGVDVETHSNDVENAIKNECDKIFDADEQGLFDFKNDIVKKLSKIKESVANTMTMAEYVDKKIKPYPSVYDMDNVPVNVREKNLSEEEIIDKVSGVDNTGGSCASLAFAYVAQKMGYDVTDFRGGNSLFFFAKGDHIKDIFRVLKVKPIESPSRYANMTAECADVLNRAEPGKQYYFSAGTHASIVRKTEDGDFQYLELQGTKGEVGWQNMGRGRLSPRNLNSRFKVNSKCSNPPKMYDFSTMKNPDELKDILCYLNTNKGE